MNFGRRTDQVRKQKTYHIELPEEEITPAADALFRRKLSAGKPEIQQLARVVERARNERDLNALLNQK